ncbi:MFS transporter [Streptosporangium sp. NPDC005286]|uniref:MFS transporter n=1 Tax=Streptosporangium sp. NPDC005286 TaxID=3154463 RepID=UPI0033BD87D5
MIGIIGLNLRAALGSVPPLLGEISVDLDLSGSMQGMLTSLGVIFMGLSAPLGQRFAARYGSEVTIAVFMGLLSVGGLMRLAATATAVLLASVAVTGIAMGAISALVPGLIAHHLPRITGLTTGIYSTGLALGVAAAAWIAVPSVTWLGGWRPALAVWGVFAALAAVAWAALLPRLRRLPAGGGPRPGSTVVDYRLPWRSTTAWWVTLFSSTQMVIGFSGLAWIAPYYAALGMSPRQASYLFVFFQVIQLLAMMTLPTITDYTRDRRPLLGFTMLAACAGIAMMILAPPSLAVLAVGLFGFGVGGGSALVLVLVSDYTNGQAQAARLGAMTLMVAFLVGALGPLALGLLHDLTGGLTAGYLVMLVLGTVILTTLPVFRPGRALDDASPSLVPPPS